MYYGFDHAKSRPVTTQLLDAAEQGVIDWEQLARDALGWMSEDEVRQFAEANDLLQLEDEEYDGQPDEAQEWADFDPDC
jgi:hypothetical protein